MPLYARDKPLLPIRCMFVSLVSCAAILNYFLIIIIRKITDVFGVSFPASGPDEP